MSLTTTIIPSIINNCQKLLTVKELLAHIGYSIDELYIDKFWDNIQEDKWIYIGDNMLEWIGYDFNENRKAKEWYVNIISKHFIEKQEYVHLLASEAKEFYSTTDDQTELPSDFNYHNKAKHLIVSPNCFKESLMLIETSKAKQIRKYYLQLESVFKFYLQYQSQYHVKQLEAEKIKNISLTANTIDYNQLQKKEYLYVATNARYASENNFKIGKTMDLKARLCAYNTSHNKREPYYYVYVSEPTYNAKSIEYILKYLLTKFKNSDTNEIYIINYSFLEKIITRVCANYNDCIDYYNECIQNEMQFSMNIKATPVVVSDTQSDLIESDTESDNDSELIEYYSNNKNYSFVRFQVNNETNFRCTHCGHITARLDAIQSHFQRKVKCFDAEKDQRIKSAKANAFNPVITYYRDNKDYGYFESYSDELTCFEFNCTRCGYKTNNIVGLKRHFDRKTKCFNMVTKTKITRDPKTNIETLDDMEMHKYYRTMGADGTPLLICIHCDYQAPDPARLRRHFKRKGKCWM